MGIALISNKVLASSRSSYQMDSQECPAPRGICDAAPPAPDNMMACSAQNRMMASRSDGALRGVSFPHLVAHNCTGFMLTKSGLEAVDGMYYCAFLAPSFDVNLSHAALQLRASLHAQRCAHIFIFANTFKSCGDLLGLCRQRYPLGD